METKKILAALAYFSALFAAILMPLIILLAAEDKAVKYHAKKALYSQLIPLIPIPFLLFSAVNLIITNGEPSILFFVILIVIIVVSIIVAIWNLVKGIQVLSKETLSHP